MIQNKTYDAVRAIYDDLGDVLAELEDDFAVDGETALESVKGYLRDIRMGYSLPSTEEILERLKKELEA